MFLWPKPKSACRGEPLKSTSASTLAIATLQCPILTLLSTTDPDPMKRKPLGTVLRRRFCQRSLSGPAGDPSKPTSSKGRKTHAPATKADTYRGREAVLGRIAVAALRHRTTVQVELSQKSAQRVEMRSRRRSGAEILRGPPAEFYDCIVPGTLKYVIAEGSPGPWGSRSASGRRAEMKIYTPRHVAVL